MLVSSFSAGRTQQHVNVLAELLSTRSPIHSGSTATYTITVAPKNGFSDAITLNCAAPGSAGIHCSMSPSSVSPGEGSTLTVTTTAASTSLMRPEIQSHSGVLYALWLPLGVVVFGGLCFGGQQGKRNKFVVDARRA